MAKLVNELERYGCDPDRESFREIIQELKAVMFPTWSIDQLVCHLADAADFVKQVRIRAASPSLPDHVILRALMNCRKFPSVPED